MTRPGEHLADYVLEYPDGSEQRQSIRRRFEVNEACIIWGQWAFAAQPHVPQVPVPWQGPYPEHLWGNYQTGMVDGPNDTDLRYWLYALPNPRPATAPQSIRLEACAGRVAIAAITLYHGASHPFQHRRLESLRVTTATPVEAQSNGRAWTWASSHAPMPCRLSSRRPGFGRVQGWGEEPPAKAQLTNCGWT